MVIFLQFNSWIDMLIKAIEYWLPEKIVTNNDLKFEHPDWDMNSIGKKTGVSERRIASLNETALDIAEKACRNLFENTPGTQEKIDGLIFCTQSPDFIMPSNAFLLQQRLGLSQNLAAFDINLACSGFVYGLAIANGFLKTKVCNNILFVTADTYSKFIDLDDRSTRVLFGDGGAVTLLENSEQNTIIDIALASSGYEYKSFYIPSGGCRTLIKDNQTKESGSHDHKRSSKIHMNGFAVWKFISQTVPKQIEDLLIKNKLTISDIDLFFFHQASKLTLDSLKKQLAIPDEKFVLDMELTGNLVSSSIPIIIKKSLDKGVLKNGHTILLSGFGVGLSWGTILLKFKT